MMKPVTYYTPAQLTQLTSGKKKEFKSLLVQLKKMKPGKLDQMIHTLHAEAFDQFDCLECANCCSSISPIVIENDIRRIAKTFRQKPAEFIDQHLEIDNDNDYVFRETPCPFLMSDNYCSIYDQRPRACKEYPHTDRKRFNQILKLSLKNCEICPVVYAIFQHLSSSKL